MKKLMSCEHATQLMSLKLDEPLCLTDKATLHMHLGMCSKCRQCNKQMEILNQATKKRRQDFDSAPK